MGWQAVSLPNSNYRYNAVTKPFIESSGLEQLAWVYSILDGEAEPASVLAATPDFIIYKDYKYSTESDITEMYVPFRCIPFRSVLAVLFVLGRLC
jgi:hypothetical protein